MALKKVFVVSAETKVAQKNVDELTEQLEIQEKVINDLTRDLERQQNVLERTSKTNLAARKKINTEIKKTKNELTAEKRARVDLNNQRKKANKTLKETTKGQQELTGVMGILDKFTGGSITGMMNLYKSLVVAANGAKLLKLALIGTGVGAIVVVLASLFAMFSQSEKGQEAWGVVVSVTTALVNEFMDKLAMLGEIIVEVFTNPKKAIEDFKKLLIENFENRMKAGQKFVRLLGETIQKVFAGDFKGAMKTGSESASAFVDSITGVENSIKKYNDQNERLLKNIAREVFLTIKVTKARQKAHHIDRELKVERAKADRKINDIRLKAEDREKFNATQRIALLKEAQAIEEEITAKEIESQKIKIKAQKVEMSLGKNTIEQKDKLAELEAKLIRLDTKKLRSQRLLQTQITTATNEENAAKQKKLDDEAAEIQKQNAAEQKRLDDIQGIRDAHEEKVKEQEAVKEEEKAILDKEKALAELEKLNATEEQKAEIIAYWNGKIQEGKNIDSENETKRDIAVKNAKLGIAKNTMALIGEIAGEGSKIGKALAIGQATISGYEGVQNAYTTAQESPITIGFPAYPIIQAGLAGAFAATNIAKIASTNPSGASGTGGLKASASAPQIQTPSFNIVGQGGVNQIASAIGDQQQQPVQAFVVSQDVTTAQSLENNIIQGATIGG